jgi:hypothetical protein
MKEMEKPYSVLDTNDGEKPPGPEVNPVISNLHTHPSEIALVNHSDSCSGSREPENSNSFFELLREFYKTLQEYSDVPWELAETIRQVNERRTIAPIPTTSSWNSTSVLILKPKHSIDHKI